MAAEASPHKAPPAAAPAGAGVPGSGRPGAGALHVAGVALASLLVCVTGGWLLGRDTNWDYLHYHAYAALQWQYDRLAQDFFAAGPQTYLNPAPFALMAVLQGLGWPAVAIGAALAAVQSLNLLLLYLIGLELFAAWPQRRLMALLSTVLGATTAVLWSQMSSSFADALLSPLVLGALWLLVRRPSGRAAQPAQAGSSGAAHAGLPTAWSLVLVGVLAGIGPALKLTLLPYALALWLAAAAVPGALATRSWRLVLVGAGALAGFVLVYAQWGWRLYREFGNPFFPLFNDIFRSPDYPPQVVWAHRFVPDGWLAALALPWRMLASENWVYTEVMAPDLRPALLVILLVAWAAIGIVRRLRPRGPRAGGPSSSWRERVAVFQPSASPERWRTVVVWVFFAAAAVLWVRTSTNGRYGVPVFLLLGPFVWLLCLQVAGARAGRVIGLVVIALQGFHLASASSPRWDGQPWTREWLPIRIPDSLQREPLLFVSISNPSASMLASQVHPRSAFTSPIGLHSIPVDGPGWSRWVAMRERWAGRTRVVFGNPVPGRVPQDAQLLQVVDDMVDRLGLALEGGDACETIDVNALPAGSAASAGRALPLVACRARLKPAGDPELAAQRALARRMTEALQARCGHIFGPATPEVEGARGEWSRRYLQHDLIVSIDLVNDLVYYRQERQVVAMPLGRVSSWADDLQRLSCALPHDGRRGVQTLAAPR